jgi:hypothetical protein
MTQVTEHKDETREYHIKKLLELSKSDEGQLEFRVDGSVWKNGKLVAEEPNEEQKEWVERRMRGSRKSWERWDKK